MRLSLRSCLRRFALALSVCALAASTAPSLHATTSCGANVCLTATSHNFVSVPEGTSVKYGITLTNTTTSAFPFSLSLTGSSNYTWITNCPANVAAGASCQIQFTYAAPANVSEYDTATFTITPGSDTFSPSNTGLLQAHSVPAGQLELNSNKHNFGDVTVNTTQQFGLSLSNGASTAVPLTFTPSGDTTDFSVASNSCGSSLAAGGACEVLFSYTPKSATSGTYSYAISTGSSGVTLNPTGPLVLLGTGQAAGGTLQLTSIAHNFIQVAQGTTSPAYGTVLTNNTNTAVNLTMSLADKANFTQTGTCPATLAAGAHCNLAFTFNPVGIDFVQTLFSISAVASGTSTAVPIYLGTSSTTTNAITLKGIGEGIAPDKGVIYQIVTDRFFDGDTTNDNPSESPGLYDSTQSNWQAYWGGDLAGIQQKLSYISGIGASAIWVSPTVNNENDNLNSTTPISAPYHGYDTRDFNSVEEHFGDNSNSWAAWDSTTASLHGAGIRMILDWAQNQSSYNGAGEYGALYNGSTLLGTATSDPNNIFHHNADISNYNDRYQLQYYTLDGLTDLDQQSPIIDSYLKTAIQTWQQHGVDGLRLDALKHNNWGWEYSFANSVYTYGQTVNNPSPFMYGEWFGMTPGDFFYADETKFANKSGINELDFGVNQALRDVFGSNNNMSELDDTITSEDTGANTGTYSNFGGSYFNYPNDLVTFFDSHDENRLYGNITSDENRLHEAMAYLLTSRGIPIILYGDEQYLYNTTNSGNDPYNRVAMSSFNTTTTAYQLIAKLSALRKANNAVGFGSYEQRWINADVYGYERQFGNSVVLVAINKNTSTSTTTSGLLTNLPAGTYQDYLGGLLGGVSLTVTGSGGNNTTNAPTLPPESVSVWVYTSAATSPIIGEVSPHAAQPGVQVTIYGDGFGTATGSVLINGVSAPVVAWGNSFVIVTVPSTSSATPTTVQVKNSSGTASSTYPFTVLTANLIPVTFTVNNANTSYGTNVYIAGNTVELGNFTPTFQGSVGPMLTGTDTNTSSYPTWSLCASMPAGQTIQFKFIMIDGSGNASYEGGPNRTYTVPTSGEGSYTGTYGSSPN